MRSTVSTKPIMEARGLSVEYPTISGEVKAVRGIDLRLTAHRTLALVGESGCGKSVTARTMMGLERSQPGVRIGGSIFFDGQDVNSFNEAQMTRFCGGDCAMIFQDALAALNPTMRVGRQIAENLTNHSAHLSRKQVDDAVLTALKDVGIADPRMASRSYPFELSGGMRQRAMIAMAMMAHPSVLIADEPTTSLDVTIQAQILDLMQRLQDETDMAILIITHDMGVVARMADDVAVMYAGKIVESGSCDTIFYHPAHPYTWALLNAVPRTDAEPGGHLPTIEGNVPDMIDPPAGCAFANRCPFAMAICHDHNPQRSLVGEGHTTACWLSDPHADRSGVPFEAGKVCHDR